jgi:hypothetical protein
VRVVRVLPLPLLPLPPLVRQLRVVLLPQRRLVAVVVVLRRIRSLHVVRQLLPLSLM